MFIRTIPFAETTYVLEGRNRYFAGWVSVGWTDEHGCDLPACHCPTQATERVKALLARLANSASEGLSGWERLRVVRRVVTQDQAGADFVLQLSSAHDETALASS